MLTVTIKTTTEQLPVDTGLQTHYLCTKGHRTQQSICYETRTALEADSNSRIKLEVQRGKQ